MKKSILLLLVTFLSGCITTDDKVTTQSPDTQLASVNKEIENKKAKSSEAQANKSALEQQANDKDDRKQMPYPHENDHTIDDYVREIDLRRKGRYTIRGKEYRIFASEKDFQEVGMASWYGPGFHGKKTANGETYNMYAMTAAHKTLPLGTIVEVTDVKSKKKIRVRINDRGPFHAGRIIDLSKKAAQELGMLKAGQTKVHVKVIGKAD